MQEQTLGDYRILKKIGAGPLGTTYLAEHRFIKKQFALKVLPEELAQDRAFIDRFEEEVVKLALLDHPHIVKVHNISFAEGLYFLVTDCVVDTLGETTNLAQYMASRKERLREEELVSVLGQVAEALDFAHVKGGVIHQSLKLNNLLVGKANPGIEIFISDFDLAKIISPSKVVARTFFAMAQALGTLPLEEGIEERYSALPFPVDKLSQASRSFLQGYAFLAPEQKRGETLGIQVDSFAFGVLAYYLIAGYFPVGIPELPSSIAPEYRYDWDQLVKKCLNPDPLRRPTQLLPLVGAEKGDLSTRLGVAPEMRLSPSLRTPAPDVLKQETPSLEPIIDRSAVQSSISASKAPEQELAPMVVAGIDVAEATPPAINPEKDEAYTAQLSTMLNRDPVVTKYQPEQKEVHHVEPLQSEMVVIPGGLFSRGSDLGNRDEMPRHKIQIESFALDIHPVTNEQFIRFLDVMGGEKDQNYQDLIRLKDSRISRRGGRLAIESGYSKHPVVGVTWYGAISYARWVGKRLPSEAEWEIAAQGGVEGNIYPTGEEIEKNQANFFGSDTTAVMSYIPNGYGLFDMAGNVYEWCQDWYSYNYYEISAQEPYAPQGPLQGVYRVLRGGCWKSVKEDLRLSHRHRNNPGTVNSTYGFRCAANVK